MLALSLSCCSLSPCVVLAPGWSATLRSSPPNLCCCCVCYIIICKHLLIMQQQREQPQLLATPQAAPGESRQREQPQQRPTGHINFPHRPQYAQQSRAEPTRRDAFASVAFQRRAFGLGRAIKCKWATPHLTRGQMRRCRQVAQTAATSQLHVAAINHKTAA